MPALPARGRQAVEPPRAAVLVDGGVDILGGGSACCRLLARRSAAGLIGSTGSTAPVSAPSAGAGGGATAAAGRAGLLPCSGAFGSQLRLRSLSAASRSLPPRCGTLLTNGIGTLVTYKRDRQRQCQTDQQSDDQAEPESATLSLFHCCSVAICFAVHLFGCADTDHVQCVGDHLPGGAQQRQARPRQRRVVAEYPLGRVIAVEGRREIAQVEGHVMRCQAVGRAFEHRRDIRPA